MEKISFETDKEVAICDYIRKHADEISFLGFPKNMKVTEVEGVTLGKTNDELDSITVCGVIRGDYILGDGTMSEVCSFTFCLTIKTNNKNIYEYDFF